MTNTNNLLPCPFCGGEPKYEVWSDRKYHKAECVDCAFEFDYCQTYKELEASWNKRVSPTPCLHQIQKPAAAEQAAWHAGLDEGRAQAAPAAVAMPDELIRAAKQALACMDGLQQHLGRAVCQVEADALRAALAATPAADAKPFLSEDDLDDLRRFEGMASDGESYDIAKKRMKRLAELGVVRWVGGSRYCMTAFGQYVLKCWDHLPLETHEEANARANAEFRARIGRLNAEAIATQSSQGG